MLEASQKRTVPSSCLRRERTEWMKFQTQGYIPQSTYRKKIDQKSEKATNPVSNMSLVKDSAPATFPPFIGHS